MKCENLDLASESTVKTVLPRLKKSFGPGQTPRAEPGKKPEPVGPGLKKARFGPRLGPLVRAAGRATPTLPSMPLT